MKTKVELVLSYIVFAIALIYGITIFIQLGFKFTPAQMSYPGMVIAFLISCTLNIVKLKEDSVSKNLHFASVFSNTLTFCYAAFFVIQDPWIGKVITTVLMGLILILSILKIPYIVRQVNNLPSSVS